MDTPAVTVDDLNGRFDYNRIEILLFLRKARNCLIPATDDAPSITALNFGYEDLDDVKVTVTTRTLSEAADWILEDRQLRPHDVAHGVSFADTALRVAESQYEEAKEKAGDPYSFDPDGHYKQIRKKVQRACIDAIDYPVVFDRHHAWIRFTEYADALLKYMAEGYPEKTTHCLPRMQRYRSHMEETADDATVG